MPREIIYILCLYFAAVGAFAYLLYLAVWSWWREEEDYEPSTDE